LAINSGLRLPTEPRIYTNLGQSDLLSKTAPFTQVNIPLCDI